jgi:hypothetical protein
MVVVSGFYRVGDESSALYDEPAGADPVVFFQHGLLRKAKEYING